MSDPLRPISNPSRNHGVDDQANSENACLPPEPGRSDAPPDPSPSHQSTAHPHQSTARPAGPTPRDAASSATAAAPPETAAQPSRRAVDLLVSRAPKPSLRADLPAERAAARALSPQAETGTTRSGDQYTDVAAARGGNAQGDVIEFFAVSVQEGAHNEANAAVFRMQSQTPEGVAVTTEVLTAKAAVSTRMLPGCHGLYAAPPGVTLLQSEWTYSPNDAEETSFALSATPSLEGGVCVRDKDADGLPEVCVRAGVGPVVWTDCSEEHPPRAGGDIGTGGGPGRSEEEKQNLGAGGAAGY